jgi:hypothetical protein
MKLRVAVALVLVAFAFSGRPAFGEAAAPKQAPEKKSSPPPKHKIGPFEISINWRTRAEGWNWFQGPKGNSDYPLWDSLLRIGIGQTREHIDWFAELEQPSILGPSQRRSRRASARPARPRRQLLRVQLQPDQQRQRILETGLCRLQAPRADAGEARTLRVFRRHRSEAQRSDPRGRRAVAHLEPSDLQLRLRRSPANI